MKLFSIINSFNVYECDSEKRITVFGKKSVKVRDVKNGAVFYAKPLPPEYLCELESDLGKRRWFELIRRYSAIDCDSLLRPVDIVDISGNLFKQDYALLIPLKKELRDYKSMSSVGILDNTALNSLNSDTKAVFSANTVLAKNLAFAWSALDRAGYLYHEFTPSHMFYCADNNKVKLDFSFSTHEYYALTDGATVPANRISPDYTDTYCYLMNGKQDVISNYFSMAVILFRLLVGLLPYQGRLLEGVRNVTKQEHSEWIALYHRNPVFIFDENDDVNRISSTTAYPDVYIKRWEGLPPTLRGLFSAVFARANVLRKTAPVYFPPQEWGNLL